MSGTDGRAIDRRLHDARGAVLSLDESSIAEAVRALLSVCVQQQHMIDALIHIVNEQRAREKVRDQIERNV